MILIDANVWMFAAGAEHPHRRPALTFLDRVARGELAGVVDAETLQEILHRYCAIRRWEEGRRVYDLARRIAPEVLPITSVIVDHARVLLDTDPRLMARDALHAAAAIEHGVTAICSYDTDFDRLDGVKRIEPTPNS